MKLERRHYYYTGAMLSLCLVIELASRYASANDWITSAQREGIALVNFIPLGMAMLVVHSVIQEARLVKVLAITAMGCLFIAQFFDFRTAVILPSGHALLATRLPLADDLFYAIGAILIVSASYYGLLEIEKGRQELRRKRERLEAESAERARAEAELRQARDELEQRVRERTEELAEKNRQLGHQLVHGEAMRAELERNRHLLREMERITQCGAWEIDIATGRITATEECRRILGIEGDGDFTTRDAVKLFPEELHPTLARLRSDALELGAPWNVEAPFFGPNGARRWMRSIGKPAASPEGSAPTLIGTVQDITELKAAEMALRESENLLHAVIRSAPIIVWVLDTEGHITFSGGLGLVRLGMTPGANLGKRVFDLYPEDTAVARLARRALTGRTCSDTLEVNGVIMQASYCPLYDAAGQLAGAIGVALDVTQERLYESRMRQNQKMEAIGALAGGIAHDFNNILYAMDGFAALAAKMVKDNASASQCIAELRSAAARARELVDRILTFSRKEVSRRETVDLVRETRDTARLVEPSLPPDIHLHLELDHGIPFISADPGQMQQMLLNLCTNARDAMRNGGGTLGIRLGRCDVSEAQAETLGGIAPGRYVDCIVSDTGTGMESYIAARLFEPFFTTKPVGEGTGLGLAIVHNIVHAHGGAIFVDSAPGAGTRVRVLLPADRERGDSTETRVALPPASAALAGPPRRIAVVDDEPQVRIFLRMLLEDAGHSVTCYRHGEEALAALLAAEQPPDVVLADLIMPGMSGVDLINALRQKYPDMPIVLCSGHVEAALSAEVRNADAAAFVKKPIDPEALLALLARVSQPLSETVVP